jgi:hypothetical protein
LRNNLRLATTITDCGALALLKVALGRLDVVDMDVYSLSDELLANKLEYGMLAHSLSNM